MTCPQPLTKERQALAQRWMRAAAALARRYSRRTPGLAAHHEDLHSAALEALCRSAIAWREDGGLAFSSFATLYMRQALAEYGRRHARVVPLPWKVRVTESVEESFEVTDGADAEEEASESGRVVVRLSMEADVEPADSLADLRLHGPALMARVEGAIAERLWAGWRGRAGKGGRPPKPARDAALFVAHCRDAISVEELAQAHGVTRQAVDQALQRGQAAFEGWAAEVRGES